MYLAFKLLHVIAVIAFVGNIVTGAVWKGLADATKDPRVIAYAVRSIIRLDRVFTIPGIVLIVIGGVGAALVAHIPILGTGWILWGIAFFIISGMAFGPTARAQRRMSATAAAGTGSGSMDWVQYGRESNAFAVWGSIATIAALLAVAVMVLKPALPAFHS